jgi:hypothetical protein
MSLPTHDHKLEDIYSSLCVVKSKPKQLVRAHPSKCLLSRDSSKSLNDDPDPTRAQLPRDVLSDCSSPIETVNHDSNHACRTLVACHIHGCIACWKMRQSLVLEASGDTLRNWLGVCYIAVEGSQQQLSP